MALTKFFSNLVVDGAGGTVLDVQGSVGQLFSVTDSLTGDLFAVSDISGIPILNVNSSGAVDIDGTLAIDGDFQISEKIIHSGDTNTYIQFPGTNDKIVFATNGSDALTLDASNAATFAGDVISDGLYINSSSAVDGTQVAIIKDGEQNLQRWGSAATGQASYRFRIDQYFKFIGNSGSGDNVVIDSSDGSAEFEGNLTVGGNIRKGAAGFISIGDDSNIVSIGQTNEMNFMTDVNSDQTMYLNHRGYNNSTSTRFRSLEIRNGKGSAIANFNGSDKKSTFAADVTIGGNLIGTGNTTELGVYPDNSIKRIRMVQGGELHFGDTTTAAPLGITEGDWNNFGDSDRMSIYGRNSIKFYSGSTAAALSLTLGTNATFEGAVTTGGKLYIGTTAATSTATTALLLGAAGEVKKRGLGSNAFSSTSFLPLAGGTVTGQVTFPSASTTKPVLPNGYIARDDNSDTDGTHDIWGISERYYPSNETDGDAWGIQWSGTPNEINFIGAGQKKLSIDLDTAGTVKIDGSVVATESYVGTQISNLIDSSPAALNTLNELAAALGDDASFSTTVTNSIATKLPLAGGTMTGTLILPYLSVNDTAGAANGSAEEVAKFANTTSGATSSYMYIGASSGTDWRLGKNILGTTNNTNFGITKHSGTDIFLEIDGSGNTSIHGTIGASNFSGSSSGTNTGDQTLPTLSSLGALSTTAAASTYLPLAGGTLTGTLTAPAIAVTANEGREVQTYMPSSYTTNDLVSGHEYGWYSDHWRLGMTRSGNTAGADFVVQSNGTRKLSLTTGGNLTVTGTVAATNFSGSSSGTNTGDQTLPTLSSLGALSTSGGTMTGALNASGGLYFVGDTHMGYVPYPIGAQFRSNSSNHTGYIKIKLPTDTGPSPDDMMSFHVDIYDYTTNEMISVFVGGYTYRTTSTSTYWYNTTAIVTAGKADRNFTVRFGNDGTNYYVAIGETTSTWAHPSIVVRDFQCSFSGNVVHYIDGWDIDITSTDLEGVDETNSNNFPASDYNKMINAPSLLAIGTTSTTAMAGNTLSAQDLTDIGNLSGTNTGDQSIASIKTGIGTGNGKLVPAAGTAGHFLKHDGTFGVPAYNTYTTSDFDAAGSADAVQSNLDTVAANIAGISKQSNTDVDTGTETIAQVSKGTYTAAFFDFVIKNGTNVRCGTVYSCHDGTNVEFTETSTVDLGDTSDVTLAVDISGTNMRLRATTTSNNWSVKSLVRAI